MRIITNMRFWQSRTWVESVVSIYPQHRLPMGRKPLSALREALALCRQSRDFDVVVTMGARESLFYGLLCAWRGRPSKQIACEVFADDPAPANPIWRIKNAAYGFVLKRTIGMLTNSTLEMDVAVRRFGMDRERLRYVPLHTNILEPKASGTDDGFALSAGATRRDYDTLVRSAVKTTFPISIVCHRAQRLPSPIPHNVTVYRDIPRSQYLELVGRCSFAVVPLRPVERATGQVTILEAMAMGKAVIATQTAGALDLIRDGINGFFVPPHDHVALASAIEQLARNVDLRQKMGEAALKHVRREHTIETHAARKLAAIRDLFERYGTPTRSVTR